MICLILPFYSILFFYSTTMVREDTNLGLGDLGEYKLWVIEHWV